MIQVHLDLSQAPHWLIVLAILASVVVALAGAREIVDGDEPCVVVVQPG